MKQFISVLLVLVMVAIEHLCLGDYNCNDEYQCSGTASVSSTESVNCRGYSSCYHCTTISAPNENLYCDGWNNFNDMNT